MDRPSRRYKIPLLLSAVILSVMISGGCVSGLTTLMYLIKGTDVDPEFKYLKDKKVAVVVRPVVDLQYRNPNVPQDLAKQIALCLQRNVPKIKVIDQQKVSAWCDENNPEEVADLGKALKADMVVSVELGGFSIFQGQTIYQGRAISSIQVIDCRDDEKKAKDKSMPKPEKDKDCVNNVVFEKSLPETKYPPNTGIPTSDKQEFEFRQEFIRVLADQIARHFYAHDANADFAQDATAMHY
jgi:hypothetical protein